VEFKIFKINQDKVINNEDNEINFNRKILIFRNEEINDFLQTEYNGGILFFSILFFPKKKLIEKGP